MPGFAVHMRVVRAPAPPGSEASPPPPSSSSSPLFHLPPHLHIIRSVSSWTLDTPPSPFTGCFFSSSSSALPRPPPPPVAMPPGKRYAYLRHSSLPRIQRPGNVISNALENARNRVLSNGGGGGGGSAGSPHPLQMQHQHQNQLQRPGRAHQKPVRRVLNEGSTRASSAPSTPEPSDKEGAEKDGPWQCPICFTATMSRHVFVPCGHLACSRCAPRCLVCPICRAEIQSELRIYE